MRRTASALGIDSARRSFWKCSLSTRRARSVTRCTAAGESQRRARPCSSGISISFWPRGERRQALRHRRRGHPQPARQLGGLDPPLARLLHPEGEGGLEVLLKADEPLLEDAAAVAPPARIEDLAAAEGRGRGGAADHEAVAAHGRDGPFEPDLDDPRLPRRDPFGAVGPQRAHPPEHLAGVEMEAHGDEAADRRRRVRQQGEAGEQAGGGLEGSRGAELHPARQLLERDAGELERGALAGRRPLARLAVDLDAAHPHLLASLPATAGAPACRRRGSPRSPACRWRSPPAP